MSTQTYVTTGVSNFKKNHSLLIVGGSEQARAALMEDITAALFCFKDHEEACGTCEGCNGYRAMRALYVEDVIPEGPHIYREQIIKILETSALTSAAHIRVLRIQQIDRITREAAVVLLKRLEEPSVSLKFILTATRAAFVLPTIRSRSAVLTLPGGEIPPTSARFHGFTEASVLAKEHGDDRAALVRVLTATLHHVHGSFTKMVKKQEIATTSLSARRACLLALATAIHDLEYTTVNARLTVDHAAAACALLMESK